MPSHIGTCHLAEDLHQCKDRTKTAAEQTLLAAPSERFVTQHVGCQTDSEQRLHDCFLNDLPGASLCEKINIHVCIACSGINSWLAAIDFSWPN